MTKNNENSDDNKGTDTSPTKTLSNTSIEQQLQQTFRYNREEMLALRDAKLSRTRPPELSRDFDSDKGLFSPDKWVQYKWQCEGIEPRRRRQHIIPVSGANAYPIGSKTLSSILESTIAATKNDDLLDNHNTMLSPQRRGFSSGCKAASPPKSDNKSHHQQQQSSSGRSRWQIKNNGSDFKPAFQKNALEASSRSSRSGSSQNNTSIGGKDGINNSSWNNSGHKHGDKNRRSGERERTRSTTTETDQVPEWVAAGPTSVFDVIELKGFDDEEEEQTANEKKRRRSRGRKDSIGNNNLKSNSETSAVCQKSSSFRQKRQSSEDITSNKSQNNIHNISRPSSHKTPQQSDSFYSSLSPVKVIMVKASDLESSILREHAEKLEKEKASILSDESNKTFDLLAALGIQPSNNKDVVGDKTISETKLPNSDAEFAACILGLPIDQIAKIMPNMLPSVNTEPQQQQDQPTTSRLIRWQKATLNAAKSENNLSRIGDEELKMALKRDLMVNDDSRMNKTLLPPRGQFIPNGQQPFVFNPPIGGPYGGGNQFQGGVHHFQNVGPSHHNNFVLPPYGAVPFTSSQQQFFPPFGSSTGLNHPNYNQNRQQSPFNPMNNQLHFPPPLVNPQQQMSAHHQNLLNSPAFMPTSVMRQMSKMPGCGSSVNSGGESPSGGGGGGSTTNISAAGLGPNNTSALLQKMFAEPVMFNPAIGGPYGGGSPFPGGGHHFQNVGPSHHSNFALPPYAMPFTPNQQFFHPFGSSSGLTHSNYNQNRQQSPFNAMNAPMNFPPPLVNPQQQMSAHHQNLINSPAFMPTSVMRQMSKMPGCGSSVNSGGDSTSVGGATLAAAATGLSSSNTSALLQKMFAEAKRNESQQQQTQSTGRAILGCDPNLEIGFLSPTEAQGSNPS